MVNLRRPPQEVKQRPASITDRMREHRDAQARKEIAKIVNALYQQLPAKSAAEREARRKGGRNRWKGRPDDPLLAQIVLRCEELHRAGRHQREINGILCAQFCGTDKPGAGRYSRETIRTITETVLTFHRTQEVQDS